MLKRALISLVAFTAVLLAAQAAWARVTNITGFNANGNNGGIVPLVAETEDGATSVTFEYYDEENDTWITIGTDSDGSDGFKWLWDTGSINSPGIDVRASDDKDPDVYYTVTIRVQNVMAVDIYGYRDPGSGTMKFSAEYTIEGQTVTWPSNFPVNETCNRYSYGVNYTSTSTKTKTPIAGNLTTIRTNFTTYNSSSSGTITFKAFSGTTSNFTLVASSGQYSIAGGLQTYNVNWLNIPKGAYIGFYYSASYPYPVYVRRYDYSHTSQLYATYGNVIYSYGNSNGGSFYSYSYYTGAPIEFTMSSYPPAVTQMEAGYYAPDMVNGASKAASRKPTAFDFISTVAGVPNSTKPNTYDFTWNTKDIVSHELYIAVRCFAGAWCSWYYEGPITVVNKTYVAVTNNLGYGYVEVAGERRNVPYTSQWLYRTPYTISADEVITKEGEEGRRYRFDKWSDGGDRTHDAIIYWGDSTLIQADYVEEVKVVVTTPYDTIHAFDGWLLANTYRRFQVDSPQQVSETVRYVCSGWLGTGSIGDGTGTDTGDFFLKSPTTIAWQWYAQYYLTINNQYGTDTGSPSGWYTTGETVRVSTTEVYALPAGARYLCTGWFGHGSIENGTGTDTGEFQITEPTTISWIWQKQYNVIVRANHGTTNPQGSVWVNEGNLITVETTPPPTTDKERYTWQGWTGPGLGTPTGDTVFVYKVTQSGVLMASWLASYYVDVTTNGTFPEDYSGWYDEGSVVEVEAIPPAAGEGERNLLSWKVDGVGLESVPPSPATPNPYSFTILGPATINAEWVKQYALEILNPDQMGVNMVPPPGTYWFFAGETAEGRVDFSYHGIVCTGYTGTGSVTGGDAPYFKVRIEEPSTLRWTWRLRDEGERPTPHWRSPMTVATNVNGTGCAVRRNPADGTPIIAYTGAPVKAKADSKVAPDSIRVGLVQNGEWRLWIVDSEGAFGERLDIAVAADGTPWLAYIKDNEPMVATFDGTAWEATVIGTQYSAENYISIAVDEDGKPHVAFYSPSESALIYGVFDEGRWNLEVVDADGNVGQYCSIGVMPVLDWPSIAYYDSTNGDLKFARKENGAWSIHRVDSEGDVGRNCSLALDPSGKPYICYQVLTDPLDLGLRVAWLVPEGWEVVDLSENNITGYDLAMAIDESGIVHVSYRNYQRLMYAWYNGVTWGVGYEIAGSEATGMTDIALDDGGNPSIVFWDGADLKYVDTEESPYTGPMETDVTSTGGGGGGGGCFVATAAFGSLAEESVLALTSVRDRELAASELTASLVRLYYAASPAPASGLAGSPALRALVRELLD